MMVTCKKRKELGEFEGPNKKTFEISIPDLADTKRRKFSVEPGKYLKVQSAKAETPETSTTETIKPKKNVVEFKITKALRKPMLEFIQFKTWSLETLVERTFEEFLDRYFPEEIVTIQTDTAIRKGRVIESVASPELDSDIKADKVPLNSRTSYIVNLLHGAGKEAEDARIIIQADRMSRSRLSFSKNAIRQLISNTASRRRDLKDYPWVVQPKYCRRYHISLRIPNELRLTKNPTEPQPKEGKKPVILPVIVPPAVKYPIEDLELARSTIALPPPELTNDFPIPSGLMGDVLMIWSFFDTFGKPISISPFSLEDFVDALCYQDGVTPCSLITECYVALLNVVITSRMENTKTTESEEKLEAEMTNKETDWVFEKKGKNWDSSLIPFNRNGWELSLLCFIQSSKEAMKHSTDILTHIKPKASEDFLDIKKQLNTLEIKHKVAILTCLLEATLDTEIIRQYIQECLEAYSETKKEFHETKRELNQIRANIIEHDKVDKQQSELSSDPENEKINDGSFSKSRSRLREEARLKEQEAKARIEERRRLAEHEMRLDKKLSKLSTDMDKYLVLRHEPLGYDRFFNSYHLFGRVAHNGGWISDGKIYICSGTKSQLDYAKLKADNCEFLTSLEPDQWYCIAEEKIEELINWLNPKGNRELELKQSLEKNLERLLGSVKKRAYDQRINQTRSSQGKRRPYNIRQNEKPCTLYVNTWIR